MIVLGIAVALFILQIGVLISGVIKGEDLFTYGYGYVIWGSIPAWILSVAYSIFCALFY